MPFCDAKGWGPTLDVDLVPCFQATILSSLPLAVFAVLAVLASLRNKVNSAGVIRPVWVSGIITMAAGAALLSSAVRLSSTSTSSQVLQGVVTTVSILLVSSAQWIDHRRGMRINAMATSFWFWSLVVAAVYIRTLARASSTSTVEFACTVALLAFSFLVLALDEVLPAHRRDSEATCNPREQAGALSILTWSYIFGKMRKGVSTTLTFQDDVWPVPPLVQHSTSVENVGLTGLFVIMLKAQPLQFCTSVTLKTVAGLLLILQPILLDSLIDFVKSWQPDVNGVHNGDEQPLSNGLLIAFGIFVVGLASTLCGVWGNDKQWTLYYRWKTAMVAIVFRKSLRHGHDARAQYDAGTVINLVDNDAIMVGFMGTNLPELIAVAIQLVGATVILWQRLSYATLVVVVGLIALGPAQAKAGDLIGTASDKRYEMMDMRVSVTSEVMKAMRLIKFYAWENVFAKKIRAIRTTELEYLATSRLGEVVVGLLSNLCPVLILAASLAVYIKIAPDDQPLDANRIFVSLAVFNLLRAPLMELSMSVGPVFRSIASMKRCVEFLNTEDAVEYVQRKNDVTSEIAIRVSAGSFKWSQKEDQNTLSDLDFDIKRNSCVAIVGKVGSAKSSILSALLGNMNKVSGNVEINGSVLYVAQTPWLFNASVRDNILLGAAYDETWYNTVVEACALEADYQTLPAGDRTEIGGRGVNLSGGQRQRISLARAVYARADVYLIDDTLSAVDAHVGRHIFDRVLGSEGLLRGTTRLFVTHSVQYLDAMDRILVMEDGRVVEDGAFEVLRSKGQKLAEIIATMEGQQHRRASSVSEDSKHTSADRSEELNKAENDVDFQVTAVSDPSEENGVLIQKEVDETGRVGLRHFAVYIRACTWPLFLIFLSSVAAAEGINLGSRYWLLHWSNENADSTSLNQWSYLGVYLGWLAGYVVVYAAAAIFYLYYVSPRASAVIHDMLLLRVIRMPLSFFDTTPIGRILTRFQSNVSSVDGGLPDEIYDIAFGLASIIVSVLPAIINSYLFLIFVVASVFILSLTLHFYLGASLSYQRMKLGTEADHLTHVDEVLGGLATVKVFNRLSYETTRNGALYDRLQGALISYYYCNRWFSLWIQIVSTAITFAATIFAIANRSSLSAASIGLSISALLSLAPDLAAITMRFGQFQNDIVALERINCYAHLPIEATDEGYDRVPDTWPEDGSISYVDVSLRYRKDLPLVLKVSFNIANGERIGVVGRTGAGKSSLILSLLRLVDLAQNEDPSQDEELRKTGAIYLSGKDISQESLTQLRSSMAVIAQESFLFQGTLRENLDPTGIALDDELWKAVDKVSLKEYVSGLAGGLDAEVQAGGDNFSQGQRQLLALARVLVTHRVRGGCKVIVLDEATAAVDRQTDSVVQRVIREEFKGVTTITVAHRLHTILDSDRVMVLDAGTVLEFDNPRVLMANASSALFSMAYGHEDLSRW
ncbi:hypothetical protein HDU88_005180 [Geranomyces variabilis]|nr:hypothetical protein HDU88_005180 [Geranomyces variabilis]